VEELLEAQFSEPSVQRLHQEVQLWVKYNVKYSHESRGTQTWERLRCWGPAATVNYGPVHSSDRAPSNKRRKRIKITPKEEKERMLAGPHGGLIAGQTGRMTVGRNITFAWARG
jgi:hypothetical protein